VDNGNQKIPFPHEKIEIIKNSGNLGYNGACNQIIRRAFYEGEENDWVLILNDDIVFFQHQIKAIIDLLKYCKDKWLLTPDWEWAAIMFSKAGAENLQYEPLKWLDETFWPGYFGDNDLHRRIKVAGAEDKHVHGLPELVPAIKEKSMTCAKEPALFGMHARNAKLYVEKWGGLPEHETYEKPYNGL